MIAQCLVFGLNGNGQSVGSLIAYNGSLQHVLNGNVVALRKRQQQREDRRTQMDDTRIGAVVKVQGMGVEAVEKHGFFQDKAFARANGLEIARFGLGKIKIAVEFVLLEGRTRTSHRQIVKQRAFCPFHYLCGNFTFRDFVYLREKRL